eukprot:CAMPEP_0172522256 /NCGR_PEP_ID=MMETSP1066-20121228/293027_1 /TAXON_ID=671091 /ORGANISM="Coscinodiscus wailesii, Strain CCMP2513" /LENGTH=59 /DNA_ID=CAMNT_0013305243 /DNA_START=1259 /DNA_END=1434 /DNA_ORIENTATION=-
MTIIRITISIFFSISHLTITNIINHVNPQDSESRTLAAVVSVVLVEPFQMSADPMKPTP